jgi:hypothetical protein
MADASYTCSTLGVMAFTKWITGARYVKFISEVDRNHSYTLYMNTAVSG